MKKLSKFKQVQFIKKTSEEAVKDIAELLDFVYIDGNHRYEYAKKDIKLYYPLVKHGGVIGGHDYVFWKNGVVRAVSEFVRQHDIKDFHTVFPDWWVIKGK
jgi:predicted O-methyltransferase YrrM